MEKWVTNRHLPARVDVDSRDLFNAMRHIYLLASDPRTLEALKTDDDYKEWEEFRDECILDFIQDLATGEPMCYNSYCGSVNHDEGRLAWDEKIANYKEENK